MNIVQNIANQYPLASREKGYKDAYHPSPSYPGNFKVREVIGDSGENLTEKEIWMLQPCGKNRCLICPLLNCNPTVKNTYSKKKYSVLTNEKMT